MVPRQFVGREEALAEIETALADGRGRVAITALHGLRGVGKTVLAAAYAEHHRAGYNAIWWIRAEADAGLRADLVGLGVRLGWVSPDEKEEPALVTVRERLRQDGDGILLIFDNARDVDALRPWLPRSGTTRAIVTSNAPNWRSVATPVWIRVWSKKIGADFLLARTGRPESERPAAEDLSEALGGLPLAHEQAAAYCERVGASFAEYRRRFEAAPTQLLDSDQDAPTEYHDRLTVTKTFELAINEAVKLHAAAGSLIMLAAVLVPEPIPLFLFSEAREAFGEPLSTLLADDGLDRAIAALRAFGLIDRESIPDERDPSITTDTIRLHRIVREVAAEHRAGVAREAVRQVLIEAMAAVYPRSVVDELHAWPRARRLDALALDLVGADAMLPKGSEAAASVLMDQLASYRVAVLGTFVQAEPLLRRALAIDEASFGSDHPRVAQSLNNLAYVLRQINRLGEAEQLYRRALAIDEANFGRDDPEVAIDLNNLALLLQDTNRLGEAERFLRRALTIDEMNLGPDHPTVASRLGNLAGLLRETQRLGEAEQLYRRALAIDEASLGSNHPKVAGCLNNLAGLLQDTQRLGEAEPLYRRALAISEMIFGPDHPEVAVQLNNLGTLLGDTNRRNEAEPLLRRASAICEASFGPGHPTTASVQNNLKYYRPVGAASPRDV
jgi:tetratricopeptide (TPR) repeat protein